MIYRSAGVKSLQVYTIDAAVHLYGRHTSGGESRKLLDLVA